MRDELTKKLQRNRDKLVHEIDTVGLWTRLLQDGVITRPHIDMCKSMLTDMERLEVLLDTLEKRDDDCFAKFCNAVSYQNPELVRKYLESDVTDDDRQDYSDGARSCDPRKAEMRRQCHHLQMENEKLQRKLERQAKMMTWLVKDSENSHHQMKYESQRTKDLSESIKSSGQKTKLKRYDLVSRREQRIKLEDTNDKLAEKLDSLKTELVETGEEIARLERERETVGEKNDTLKAQLIAIRRTNVDNLESVADIPSTSIVSLLTPLDLERLDVNKQFIVESCGDLSRRDLLPVLDSLNSRTRSRGESIDNSETTEQLFNTVRSLSMANYETFLACLRKLEHSHVADVLDYGGVSVKLIVQVRLTDVKRKNPIDRLNDYSNRDLVDSAFAQCGCPEVKFLRARLSNPAEDKSMELWVWCLTEGSVQSLRVALEAKTLLRQLVMLFEKPAIGISENGFKGLFLSSGKPTAVASAKGKLLNGTFCRHLPFCRIVRKLTTLTPNDARPGAVTGVAFVNDTAYVVHVGSTKIHVYHRRTSSRWEPRPEILLPEVRCPVDMAAHGDRLYVLERDGECFWRVILPGEVQPRHQQPVEKFDTGLMASALSFTPDGHLLLTVRRARSSLVACSAENGNQLCEIQLPREMEDVGHGRATIDGGFVVTHRRKVALLNRAGGQVIHEYCGDVNIRSRLVLDTPCHVTSDDDGLIFVADQDRRRVLAFDSKLQNVRVLLNTGKWRPNRMCFDVETGHMLVGLDDGSVEVYMVNETRYHGVPENEEEESN